MFNYNTSADTKIAVLEERLSAYEAMMRKIDEAIQLMGKTSQNISKMLAVHEERIEQCGKADDYISRVIDELRLENKDQHEAVTERIEKIEIKLEDLSKTKWMTIGIASAAALCITVISSLASGVFTPSEVQMKLQGHTHSVQENRTPNN